MEYKFDHYGVPIKVKREGMIYFPDYKVWCADYEKDLFRIEWCFFEEGSPLPRLVQTTPHVCFIVKDMQKALKGTKVLYPLREEKGYIMAFIDEDGAVIELMQLTN